MIRPNRQKWLLVLVAILILTNLATLSFLWFKKQPPFGPGGPDAGRRGEKRMGQFMVDQMKFDSQQETAYWKLRDSLVTIQRPVMDSIRTAKKNFFNLLNQTNTNDSILRQRSNEIGELQKRLDILTFRHFQQVRSLCRPDQLQKFDTVIKEIVTRMTPFHRPGQGGPGFRSDSSHRQ